jgi:hypothetical protein
MSNEIGSRVRYGEAFWRAHHEAWQQSALNQREYCEAHGIPLNAFGNWRAKFKAEPQPPRSTDHDAASSGMKVHLAFGYIDMRKGIDGLAMLVQGVLRQDLFSGHLFVFRGRKANLIKIVYWDGTGLCLFTRVPVAVER